MEEELKISLSAVKYEALNARIHKLETAMQEYIYLSDKGLWPEEVKEFREKFKQLLRDKK